MKKETLITIVVFLGVGFLSGYAYNAHRNSTLRQTIAEQTATEQSAAPQANTAAPDPASSDIGTAGLPKGHPPVNAQEIVQFFESAAARNPQDPEPRLKLADFLYDQQHWAEAIPWYRQGLALSPRNVDAMTDMSTCLFHVGDFNQALNELSNALKIDPHHEPTLFNMIIVNLEGTHNLAAARQAWKRLNSMDPAYPNLQQLKQSLDAEVASPGK